MDESEIDQWYEDEKQNAMDRYLKSLDENKNRDEAEKKFNEEMDKIMKKYNNLMVERIGNEKNGSSKLKYLMGKIAEKISFIKRK